MKSKIRTMKSTQQPTDEEIQGYMDFDKLLRERDKLVVRQKMFTRGKIAGIGVVVLMVGALWYFTQTSVDANTKAVSVNNETVAKETVIETAPTVSEDKTTVKDEIQPSSAEGKKPVIQKQVPLKPEKTEETKASGEPKLVYQQPEPVNGYPELYAYFDHELTYPQSALKDSIQGVVTVGFAVNAEGKADDIRIENSLGKAFDDEVLRVIRNMPAWKPAYYNGKLVKSRVSLPLTFQLTKVSSQN